jgi:molybdopterin-guanine dinucleotide biosynthesis protein A
MGRDKALLELGGITIVEKIAEEVRTAAGSVTLIGPPEKYGHLGLSVAGDKIENCGPIGGLYTALSLTDADWNLVVACDMPNVSREFLTELFEAAEGSGVDCVVPETAGDLHPLCAVYHRRGAWAAKFAIDHKLFKMLDFLSTIHVARWPSDTLFLWNANTPAEWSAR